MVLLRLRPREMLFHISRLINSKDCKGVVPLAGGHDELVCGAGERLPPPHLPAAAS